MRRASHIAGLGLAVLLVVSTGGLGRWAHATLIESNPADGSTLGVSPSEVRLRLAEDISLRFSTVQLLDVSGQAVDSSAMQLSRPEPGVLVLTLPELLPGVYSVFYKTLSEADGHFTRGLTVFGVGVPAVRGAGAAAVSDAEPPTLEIFFRWLFFSSALVMVGALAVAALVLDRPGASSDNVVWMRQRAVDRVLTCAIVCAGSGLLAGLGNLWSQAAVLQAEDVADGSVLAVAWTVLCETRWGTIWWIREISLGATEAVLLLLFRSQSTARVGRMRSALDASNAEFAVSQQMPDSGHRPMLHNPLWLAAAALSVTVAIAQALMGHAAGVGERSALVAAADVVHLLAAGVWAGGIISLVVAFVPYLRRDVFDFATIARAGWGPFSLPAAISVALLIMTGVFSLGHQVASVDALIGTPYGQALLAKIGIVLLMGGIGLVNLTTLHSMHVHAFVDRACRLLISSKSAFPTLIRCDIGAAFLVILIASAITANPAPRGLEFLVAAEDVHSVQSKAVDDVVVTLSVKPNLPGPNVLTVFAASQRRPAPAEIMRVILRFTYRDRDIGRVSAVAQHVERDRFVLAGSHLSLTGAWAIDVVVRRRGVEDIVARFDWTVPPAGDLQPTILSKRAIRPTTDWLALTALLLIAAAIVMRLAMGRRIGRRGSGSGRLLATLATVSNATTSFAPRVCARRTLRRRIS